MRLYNRLTNMRIITLCFVLFLMGIQGLHAQDEEEEQRLTISGQVIDSDLKEPIVQATIQLFAATDSTFVGGTVTNEKGTFSVDAPSSGTYKIKISSLGFQSIEREVTLRRNEHQDLGPLLMSAESIVLRRRSSPVVPHRS